MFRKLALAALLCSTALSAQAQDGRYSTWTNPDAQKHQSAQMSDMLKELRQLVGEAEKARAADPNFLKDLKNLAARYDRSAMTLLFKDDFVDGDYTANPKWTVASGKYWVERGYGLRSFVEEGQASTSSSQDSRKVSQEELIIGVLGAVLGGKVQKSGSSSQNTTTQKVEAAEIFSPLRISNDFSLNIELSSWKNKGRFDIGIYQGSNRNTGYRLVYRPGANPALQLLRNYAKSSSVIDTVASVHLEDQKNHVLTLSRTRGGEMKLTLDGKVLMNVVDRSFRDAFSGVVLKNAGGDYIIKHIEISGS